MSMNDPQQSTNKPVKYIQITIGRPMRSLIKVLYHEDGRKLERTFDFGPDLTCRLGVEQVCSTFSIPESWSLAMWSKKHGGWIHDETRLMDITFKGQKILELRTKTPSYFEAQPSGLVEPTKAPSRDTGSILRGPSSPIDQLRFFNFMFRSTDDQFITKFQKGSIYLSVILFSSDNKILLSPNGVPPTVLVSTMDLANYYNFDTESADFGWMFKTTLDWASEYASSSDLSSRGTQFTGSDWSAIDGSSSNISPPTSVGTSSDLSRTTSLRQSFRYIDRRKKYRREKRLRQEYVAAVEQLQQRLGIAPIDLIYDKVVDLPQVGAKNIFAIQYIKDCDKEYVERDLLGQSIFRWRPMETISNSIYTRKEEIWPSLTSYYDSVKVTRPSSGLYIGLYYTESTMAGLHILVPSRCRTFVPMIKLRDNPDTSEEEWRWIQSTTTMDANQLAKSCSVSKDDPMHHLKVEFAHAAATLSRQTQLKWCHSDMYTLDTMRVDVPADSRGQSPKTASTLFPVSPRLKPESLAAMDMDPIWKEQSLRDSMSMTSHRTIRVIMFIKPTRHVTQNKEIFNRQMFELCPFPVFDALHHSVFNTATYHPLRKSMQSLSNEIEDLEKGMINTRDISIRNQPSIMGQLLTNGDRACIYQPSTYPPVPDTETEPTESAVTILGSDMVNSLMIDELGIKSEGQTAHGRPHYRQHPRLRASFIGDDTINKSISSLRSASNLFLDVFNQSESQLSTVLSLASTLSPYKSDPNVVVRASTSTPSLVLPDIEPPVRPPVKSRSASSLRISNYEMGQKSEVDESKENTSRRGSADPGFFSFMDMMQELDGDLEPPEEPNKLHPFSYGTTPKGSTVDRTPKTSTGSKESSLFGSSPSQGQKSKRENDGPSRFFTRHRRGHSQTQSRDRQSAMTDGQYLQPGLDYGDNQPTIRRASLATSTLLQSKSRGPSPSRPALGANIHRTPDSRRSPSPILFDGNSIKRSGSPPLISPLLHSPLRIDINISPPPPVTAGSPISPSSPPLQYTPELERLERQQQDLQKQWRMVSWTRQLNDWDHARTLKSQQQILNVSYPTVSPPPIIPLPSAMAARGTSFPFLKG